MKIKALVIAPYSGLAELTASLQAELPDFDITVKQGDLSEVFPLLSNLNENKHDLIISRGGTAKLLRTYVSLPVVEIPISGFDILRILTLVKGYHAKIEMVGFPNVIEGFFSISSLMNMDISYSTIEHEDEVDKVLQRAKENGAKVIVGDNITVKKAAENGMQGVLITSGRESVLEAFQQAKRIYQIQQLYVAKSSAFEELLNSMDIGYILIDGTGIVRFANHAFRSLLNIEHINVENLHTDSTFCQRLIKDIHLLALLDEYMVLHEEEADIGIIGGRIPSANLGEELFYLKAQPDEKINSEIRISYANHIDQEFPHLIMSSIQFQGQGKSSKSVMAVYGEKGVGKRLFTLNMNRNVTNGSHCSMLEINIVKTPEKSFSNLALFLTTVRNRTLYILGAEKLTGQQQNKLSSIVQQSDCRIVFSFLEDPIEMRKAKQLEGKLLEVFEEAIAYIPPLRDRLHQMDEYIRTFLIACNEKYGKQIVGLRPKVMETLLAHPWHENLFELRDAIDFFVKHTEGEFIREDVLHFILDQNVRTYENLNADTTIDLTKTLEEIEKDIIHIVLREENMNQTKAAKRLGMNRSTLWRKLK